MADLDAGTAEAYLATAAANILRPYPNAPATVANGPADALTPRELHPAFYGSFDWHSSVHQHWLVARLLRLFPDLPSAGPARRVLHQTLTPMNISSEIDYLRGPNRKTFERTYGWAWLVELDRELLVGTDAGDADAAAWRAALAALVALLVERWLEYLPRAWYPIRAGTHANSAFGLSFLLEHARATDNQEATDAVLAAVGRWFVSDDGYDGAARFEPSGADFLSPTLAEADLMARVLGSEFVDWFDVFLPDIPPQLLKPVHVIDRADGHLVHLDGLNLTRAWHWRRIASRLPSGDFRIERARAAADDLFQAGLPGVLSGEFTGEHWLATFAVLAMSDE